MMKTDSLTTSKPSDSQLSDFQKWSRAPWDAQDALDFSTLVLLLIGLAAVALG